MKREDWDKQKRYRQIVQERGPKPNVLRDVWRAFLVGGAISVVGEAVYTFLQKVEPTDGETAAVTLAVMILIGAVLTAVGVYDDIAEYGGAGAAIPITGFSNTVVSAAMDFKREGFVLGMGSKMFVVAGPVIVFGVLSGFTVGLIKAAVMGLFK